MTEHNNPPAFPQPYQKCDEHMLGMSLLDYLAGLAMQSQIGKPLRAGDDEAHRLISERAYRLADAMLKERAKWIK